MEAPASTRIQQQEAREQAFGPQFGPQIPQVLPPPQMTWEQQWQQYTEAEQTAMIAANYEHLRSANVEMIDEDDV